MGKIKIWKTTKQHLEIGRQAFNPAGVKKDREKTIEGMKEGRRHAAAQRHKQNFSCTVLAVLFVEQRKQLLSIYEGGKREKNQWGIDVHPARKHLLSQFIFCCCRCCFGPKEDFALLVRLQE